LEISNQQKAARKALQEEFSEIETAEGRNLIRKKFVAMQLEKERVESFLEINCLAFDKILKKFDKRVSFPQKFLPLKPQVMPSVDKILEKQTASLGELSSLIENLFEKVGSVSQFEAATMIQESESEDLIVADDYPTVSELVMNKFSPGSVTRLRLMLVHDGMAGAISVPVIVVKGKFEGPVCGITAALHGNELNGIPLIHKLIRELSPENLTGTLVAIPVLNPPGFLRHQRGYFDGADLNRLFPGKPDGNCGQIYCHRIMEKVVKHFDYHIDLHTASFGRINSLYVRADMNNPTTHYMALLQNPQIIVHNTAPDGSLRDAAMKRGIPSITVEIGDPSSIHKVCDSNFFLLIFPGLCQICFSWS